MKSARSIALAMLLGTGALTLLACSSEEPPTPADPVLAQGQKVYRDNCASCHGSAGGGGAGIKLAGVVEANFPNIADHIAVIVDGRAGMPAFGDKLSAEDIEAVARYEREVL